MLAISTAWNYKPQGDLKAWLKQIKNLGFDAIEINYSFSRLHLEILPALLKELNLKVVSVHNFCPLPDDASSPRHASNYYRISALNEQERLKAVEWTKKTIDTAKKFNAQVVVVHAGTVELEEEERFPKLFQLYREGKINSPEFKQERERILHQRALYISAHLECLNRSFDDIMPYAQENNIKIGLEARYYPAEIPNFEEVGYFLNQFHALGMFYWHDVGHAEINDRLGIYSHEKILKMYQDKMIGVHLHGMAGRHDHKAPFMGDFDLTKYLKYFDSSVIKVVETHQSSVEEMKESVGKFVYS